MPALPRGQCPTCQQEVALRKHGLVREHRGFDGEVCKGSGLAEIRWHTPRCPNCGSENVREWGKVFVGYHVGAIGSNGSIETTDASDTAWDSYEYVELMCRDCDHTESDPTKFIPTPDIERGEN